VYTKFEKLYIAVTIIRWTFILAFLTDCLSLATVSKDGLSSILARPTPGTAPNSRVTSSLLLIIMGGALRAWCYQALGTFFTWEVAIRSDHRLVTTGPYAFVRHPSYVGLWLAYAGTIGYLFCSDTWFHYHIIESGGGLGFFIPYGYSLWCLAWFVMLIGRTKEEDRIVAKTFGKDWEDWADRVRWWFIPYVY